MHPEAPASALAGLRYEACFCNVSLKLSTMILPMSVSNVHILVPFFGSKFSRNSSSVLHMLRFVDEDSTWGRDRKHAAQLHVLSAR